MPDIYTVTVNNREVHRGYKKDEAEEIYTHFEDRSMAFTGAHVKMLRNGEILVEYEGDGE